MSIDLERWARDRSRLLAAGLVGSVVGGVASGLLARLAMSIIAGAGGDSTQAPVGVLTFAGTLRIVLTPIIFGLPLVYFYLWLGRRLWSTRPVLVRAVLYALASFVLPGLILITDSEFNIPGPNGEIGRLAFIPSYLAYGLFSGLAGEWWLSRKSKKPAEEPLPAEA